MYKFINKYYKINQSGFTYIEAIISITLTLVAAGAISFGVGKAVRTYKSIYLKCTFCLHETNATEPCMNMLPSSSQS